MHRLKQLIKEDKAQIGKIVNSNNAATWVKRSDLLNQQDGPPDSDDVKKSGDDDDESRRKLVLLAQTYSRPKRIRAADAVCPDTERLKRSKCAEWDLESVYRRLHQLNQPLKLYGETEQAVVARLQSILNAVEPSSSQLQQPTSDIAELESPVKPNGDMCDEDCPRVYDEVPHIPKTLNRHSKIKIFIRTCLQKWANELNSRPLQERETAKGKRASNLYNVTRKDLKPLLRQIQDDQLDGEKAEKLEAIIDYCISGDYIKAHDKYIELAIGNAAWPMGVTMVGIHERVGRSKIASSEIAHILDDETTWKYILMIKRLMSICQGWYPTDPSKMVQIATTSILGGETD